MNAAKDFAKLELPLIELEAFYVALPEPNATTLATIGGGNTRQAYEAGYGVVRAAYRSAMRGRQLMTASIPVEITKAQLRELRRFIPTPSKNAGNHIRGDTSIGGVRKKVRAALTAPAVRLGYYRTKRIGPQMRGPRRKTG